MKISRNKYWDDMQRLRDAEYSRRVREAHDNELLCLKLRVDMLEQMVQELVQEADHKKRLNEMVEGAKAYLKEHYDGEEEL